MPSTITWIRQHLNIERDIFNIINVTLNSYGPWIKIDREIRSEYVRKYMDLAVMDGKIEYNVVTEKYGIRKISNLPEMPTNLQINLDLEDLRRIDGLSWDSAINWFTNSNSKISKIPVNLRSSTISRALTDSINSGILTKNGGKLYLNKK